MDRPLGSQVARYNTRWVASAFAALLFAWASPARAGAPRYHDGLYLRLGGGLGHLSSSAESEAVLGNPVEANVTALSLLGELALGATVSDGLVLGGGLFVHRGFDARADDARWGNARFDVEFGTANVYLIGPMLDYYVQPSSGFHLQGSLGWTLLSLSEGEFSDSGVDIRDQSGAGPGLVVGLGYEWWISSAWSLGVLGRVTLASVDAETDDEVDFDHTVLCPGALFTATFN
ncbi:MAG: hypothetical protein JW940_05000 [Polyangiaceae bacterium]|nr:hypothetical protein [Polyangiaceae bacterium]